MRKTAIRSLFIVVAWLAVFVPAAALRPFADNPMGKTFGVWDPHSGVGVRH
jgi:hypothetical protein